MEYILRAKRSELTSKLMLSGSDGLSNDLRKMDPETQARLEALLEAAGKHMLTWQSTLHMQRCIYLHNKFHCFVRYPGWGLLVTDVLVYFYFQVLESWQMAKPSLIPRCYASSPHLLAVLWTKQLLPSQEWGLRIMACPHHLARQLLIQVKPIISPHKRSDRHMSIFKECWSCNTHALQVSYCLKFKLFALCLNCDCDLL